MTGRWISRGSLIALISAVSCRASTPCAKTIFLSSVNSSAVDDLYSTVSAGARGLILCVGSIDGALVPLARGPLRPVASIAIQAIGPHPVAFDGLGVHRAFYADLSALPGSWITLDGISTVRTTADEGGAMLLRAGVVLVRNGEFSQSSSTMRPAICENANYDHVDPSCLRGGGALSVEANRTVLENLGFQDVNSSLSGAGVLIKDTPSVTVRDVAVRHAEANWFGMVAVVSSGDMVGHAYELHGLRFERTQAYIGAGLAVYSHGDVSGSNCTTTNLSSTHGFARRAGGAAAYMSRGNVVRSNTTLEDFHVRNCRAYSAGGGVVLATTKSVRDSMWHARGVKIASCRAGFGAALYAAARWNISRTSISMSHFSLSDCRSHTAGGGIFIENWGQLHDSTVSVENVTAHRMVAGHSGSCFEVLAIGGVSGGAVKVRSFYATDCRANAYGGVISLTALAPGQKSRWELADVHAVDCHAHKDGGAISLFVKQHAESLVWEIRDSSFRRTSAKASGGAVVCTLAPSANSSIALHNITAWHVHASQSGGFATVQYPGGGHWSDIPNRVSISALRVSNSSARETGGVMSIHSGLPHQIPWRKLGPHCTERACEPKCNITAFPSIHSHRQPVVAYNYPLLVTIQDVGLWNASSQAGGGFSFSNVQVRMNNLFADNVVASSRGGLWTTRSFSDVAAANVHGTCLYSGWGTLFQQAVSPGNLSLTNVTLSACPRGDKALAMSWPLSAGAVAVARLSNVTLECPPGFIAKNDSRGLLTIVEPGFQTVSQGTFFASGASNCPVDHDLSPQSFSYLATDLACEPCKKGTYALQRHSWTTSPSALRNTPWFPMSPHDSPAGTTRCIRCPTSAHCAGGASVRAHSGHWGATQPERPHLLIPSFPTLLFGYACRSEAECNVSAWASCRGFREGWACGRCRRGYGEVIGSPECVHAGSCHTWASYASWALSPVLLVGIAVTFLMLAGGGSDPYGASAIIKVLFVLFQLEAVVRLNDEDQLSAFSQIALLQPSLPSSVCLWEGMSATAKATLPVLAAGALLLVFATVYAVHHVGHGLEFSLSRPRSDVYARALIAVAVVSYGAITSVCLSLLTPLVVEVAEGRQSWYQALTGAELFSSSDQWLAVAWIAAAIIPAPAWVVYGMAHLRAGTMLTSTYCFGILAPLPALAKHFWTRGAGMARSDRRISHEVFLTLSAPFKPEFWYWDAVLLLERLAFAVLSLCLSFDVVARGFAMVVASALLFMLHVHTQPFKYKSANAIQSLAFVSLVCVCATSLVAAYANDRGNVSATILGSLHSSANVLLAGVPLLSCVVVVRARLARGTGRGSKVRIRCVDSSERRLVGAGTTIGIPLLDKE